MTTVYRFENETVKMELSFMTPLLMDDLKLMSRPISYISYKLEAMDGKEHTAHIIFGFSCETAVNTVDQEVTFGETHYSLYCSSGTENMLKRSGDDHRIEWGSFHVIAPHWRKIAMPVGMIYRRIRELYFDNMNTKIPMGSKGVANSAYGKAPAHYMNFDKTAVYPDLPALMAEIQFTLKGEKEDFLAVGYDDIKSIQYFGEDIEAYWRKDGETFLDIMKASLEEYTAIKERVYAAEEDLLKKARALSPKYADILALAYRQAIAAHKLTYHDGEVQFFSKENYSNGCIATVDVTYPSIPLFLIYNPTLVEGMLNPIFKLIDKGLWDFSFAPHDAGQYPLANRQVYGFDVRYFFRGTTPHGKADAGRGMWQYDPLRGRRLLRKEEF